MRKKTESRDTHIHGGGGHIHGDGENEMKSGIVKSKST